MTTAEAAAIYIIVILFFLGGIVIGWAISNKWFDEFPGRKRIPEYGNVYYDLTEPNILRHVQGKKVTIYKKVSTEKPLKEQ